MRYGSRYAFVNLPMPFKVTTVTILVTLVSVVGLVSGLCGRFLLANTV
jgi:hypothetical protein